VQPKGPPMPLFCAFPTRAFFIPVFHGPLLWSPFCIFFNCTNLCGFIGPFSCLQDTLCPQLRTSGLVSILGELFLCPKSHREFFLFIPQVQLQSLRFFFCGLFFFPSYPVWRSFPLFVFACVDFWYWKPAHSSSSFFVLSLFPGGFQTTQICLGGGISIPLRPPRALMSILPPSETFFQLHPDLLSTAVLVH